MSTPVSCYFRLLRHKLSIAILALACTSAHGDDLADIFNLAAEKDPQIREARARYNASHTIVNQGRSQLLPAVNLTGITSRDTAGAVDAIVRQDGSITPPWSYANGFNTKRYNLSIRQNLLNFEAWYAYKSAKHSDQVAAITLAQAEQQLILKVTAAYFDVLRSLDNLASFQAEEDASARILDQTSQRFEVGLIAITDVYDSQAGYDLARVNRLVEENNLAQSYEALAAITGQTHEQIEMLNPEFPIVSADPANLEEWVSMANQNNLALKAAEFDLEAKKEDAKAARAAMLPVFDLSVGYGWGQSGNPLSFTPGLASVNTNISLNVTVPLFAGGLNSARKSQAYYLRDASEELLLQTERQSTQSTRNSFRSVETDVLAVSARAQAIVSAQAALEATEVGAEVGTRNTVDVVLAQRTLFQTRRDYANARYNYIINTLNLKQAAGTLSPEDIFTLNEWLQ